MIDWSVAAGYTISGAMLIMMAIGIALSAFMPALDRWSRRFFITFFSLLFLYAAVITTDMITYTNPDLVEVEKVIFLVEYLFFSVLTVMPVPFLLHCCSESPKGSILLRTVTALWASFVS